MALNIRVPFNDSIESRDYSLDKDSITTNVFFDAVPEGTAVVKRPGLENLTSALGLGIQGQLGVGQGIFYYEDEVFSFNGPNPGTTYQSMIAGPAGIIISARNPGSPADRRQLLIKPTGDMLVVPQSGSVFLADNDLYYGLERDIISERVPITSPDGVIWTEYPSGGSVEIDNQKLSAGFLGTTIVAVSHGGEYSYVSTDMGQSYTRYDINITNTEPGVVVVSNGTTMTNGRFYTTDGINWFFGTGSLYQAGFEGNSLVYAKNKFIQIPGNVYTSLNGIAWTSTPPIGIAPAIFSYNPVLDLFAGVTEYFDVSLNRYVVLSCTSPDGITWTNARIVGGLPLPKQQITYQGIFYAISEVSGGPFNIAFILRSEDGVNWSTYVIDVALFDKNPTLIAGQL